MIERHYYLRKATDNGNHRCGVVYIILDGSGGARGVALCNDKKDPFMRDPGFIFDKSIETFIPFEGGLKKARKRAFKALHSKKSSGKIRLTEAKDKVQGLQIVFKSEWAPLLNELELKILNSARAK